MLGRLGELLTFGFVPTLFCMIALPVLATAGKETGLSGAEWVATRIQDVAAPAKGAPTLRINAEGRVSGFAGCNRLSGTARIDGTGIAFGPLATTRMACAGPSMELEAGYLKALGAVTRFDVTNAKLVLLDANDRPLLMFVRAG